MDSTKAKKLIKDNGGSVFKTEDGWSARLATSDEYELFTDRELIKVARDYYTSENIRSYKKYVKQFGRRKNRRATRDAIAHENFESIPPNKRTKDEDVWGWD
jgi:hypothetical protein